MVKFIQNKTKHITSRGIKLFNILEFKCYKDTVYGNHYGISIGTERKNLNLLFRQWDKVLKIKNKYDA